VYSALRRQGLCLPHVMICTSTPPPLSVPLPTLTHLRHACVCPAELHVIQGVPSYIFVKANYAIEVSRAPLLLYVQTCHSAICLRGVRCDHHGNGCCGPSCVWACSSWWSQGPQCSTPQSAAYHCGRLLGWAMSALYRLWVFFMHVVGCVMDRIMKATMCQCKQLPMC
jgi:hypothetical protein